MQLVDLSKPGEKKKLIMAGVLGLVAIVFLYWVLIGFGSGPSTSGSRVTSSASPQQRPAQGNAANRVEVSVEVKNVAGLAPIEFHPSSYSAPEAKRNIFAFYDPPVVKVAEVVTPTPTPTPTPPILLASVSPSNVYARTADFKLEVSGDKFSPDLRIFVDGRELATSYKSPQQLSATVAASMIANPGARQVVVRTPDNRLYSNPATVNVAAPPTPSYTYIGIIGRTNRVEDVALVQERNNKNIINVLRGDILSGRFRVTSISEKELVLTDTTLKIKHTITMSEADKNAGPLSRPTPRVDAEDDEP